MQNSELLEQKTMRYCGDGYESRDLFIEKIHHFVQDDKFCFFAIASAKAGGKKSSVHPHNFSCIAFDFS
jgi:hypothetical protein